MGDMGLQSWVVFLIISLLNTPKMPKKAQFLKPSRKSQNQDILKIFSQNLFF